MRRVHNLKCQNCGHFVHLYQNKLASECPKCGGGNFGQLYEEWNSDLSEVKVGDWIATNECGWVRVKYIKTNAFLEFAHLFPIETEFASYSLDGRLSESSAMPAAYLVPPPQLLELIGPKPEFAECTTCHRPLTEGKTVTHYIDKLPVCGRCFDIIREYKTSKCASEEQED